MAKFTLATAALLAAVSTVTAAFAHGDEPHPKCKKGFVQTDDHRCVKAPAAAAVVIMLEPGR